MPGADRPATSRTKSRHLGLLQSIVAFTLTVLTCGKQERRDVANAGELAQAVADKVELIRIVSHIDLATLNGGQNNASVLTIPPLVSDSMHNAQMTIWVRILLMYSCVLSLGTSGTRY